MQLNINFISLFISMAVILGLFISVLILTVKKKNKLPNIILALFLLTTSISLSLPVIYDTNAFRYMPFLIRLGEPFRFLIAPCFYFYAVALTSGRLKFKWPFLLHFIPFFIYVSLLIPFFAQTPDVKIKYVLDNFIALPPSFIAYNLVLFIFMLMQFIVYGVLINKEVKAFDEKVRDNFSSIDKINLSWLNFIANTTLAFCAFLLLSCIFIMFNIILWPLKNLFNACFRPIPIFISLLLILIVFKALRQPLVLSELPDDRDDSRGKKYETSNLQPEEAQNYFQKLKRYMESEKPYIEPELTLQQLSESLNIPVRHLSQVINEKAGYNFYNYINSYRVEEIKKYLVDPDLKSESILNLALDAGFNSKATFNAVFKQFTGLTPRQFRENTSFSN